MTDQATSDIATKIAEQAARRAARQADAEATTETNRQQSWLAIGDVEEQSGKTLGVDLAAVWLPDGRVIVVQKPCQAAYESYQIKAQNNGVDAKVIDAYTKASVVYPTALFVEPLYRDFPGAKFAVALLATRMAEADQKSLEGKS
jgi:hypothetical protein